jgi:hypothetical protein
MARRSSGAGSLAAVNSGRELGAEAARRLSGFGGHERREGLTDAEFDQIEQRYGFEFADDHRAFLAAGLPIGKGWPDWRYGDPGQLRDRLGWPVEGVLFDVEMSSFWYEPWGDRPAAVSDRVAKARQRMASVPTMVPVYSHRCLPAGRGTFGHPVLSMHQTDIIIYGDDLADYITHEFGQARPGDPDVRATVPFWRDLVS